MRPAFDVSCGDIGWSVSSFFSFSEDVLVTPKVDNCGSDVVQAVVIAIIVVVIDKDTNLFLQIAWQVIISQQHAVFMVWCQRSILP